MYGYNLRNDLPMLYDFYIVARELSYTKAAEKSYISQSNLSRTIRNLEGKYKIKLFSKIKKGIELTLDGERLFNIVDSIFCNLIKKNDLFDENSINSISIGTTRNIADYRLEKLLTKFYGLYPHIKMNIFTDNATNLRNRLNEHKLDCIIDYLPYNDFSEKSDFEIVKIGEFKTCFACTKEFYKKRKKEIYNISDLNKFNLVIPGKSRRRDILDKFLQEKGINLEPKIEMPDSKLMIDFISKNDFIGYFVEDEIVNTNLQKIELANDLPLNTIGIIYHKNASNELTKHFVELIKE